MTDPTRGVCASLGTWGGAAPRVRWCATHGFGHGGPFGGPKMAIWAQNVQKPSIAAMLYPWQATKKSCLGGLGAFDTCGGQLEPMATIGFTFVVAPCWI